MLALAALCGESVSVDVVVVVVVVEGRIIVMVPKIIIMKRNYIHEHVALVLPTKTSLPLNRGQKIDAIHVAR